MVSAFFWNNCLFMLNGTRMQFRIPRLIMRPYKMQIWVNARIIGLKMAPRGSVALPVQMRTNLENQLGLQVIRISFLRKRR